MLIAVGVLNREVDNRYILLYIYAIYIIIYIHIYMSLHIHTSLVISIFFPIHIY